jgi:hypothetical protein
MLMYYKVMKINDNGIKIKGYVAISFRQLSSSSSSSSSHRRADQIDRKSYEWWRCDVSIGRQTDSIYLPFGGLVLQ